RRSPRVASAPLCSSTARQRAKNSAVVPCGLATLNRERGRFAQWRITSTPRPARLRRSNKSSGIGTRSDMEPAGRRYAETISKTHLVNQSDRATLLSNRASCRRAPQLHVYLARSELHLTQFDSRAVLRVPSLVT